MRRSVVFDLDGTLVHSAPDVIAALEEALRECGHSPVPSIPPSVLGPPISEILERLGLGLRPEEVAAVTSHFRRIHDSSPFVRTRPFDGILECLTELAARGCDLFIATNKPAAPAVRIVERDFGRRFLGTCCIDSLPGHRLTKAEMLSELASRFELRPSESAMVGDGVGDLEAGKLTGWWRVAALWGYGSAQELHAQKPDAVASSPRDVGACLAAG